MKSSDAVINAVGIALGNASLLYSFAIIWIIYLAMGVSTVIWPQWRYRTDEEILERQRYKNSESGVNPIGIHLTSVKDASGSIDNGKAKTGSQPAVAKVAENDPTASLSSSPTKQSNTLNRIGAVDREHEDEEGDSDDEHF
jgi:hypothetical protein